MSRLPSIGVTACSRQNGMNAGHISSDKCVSVVASTAPGLLLMFADRAARPSPSVILDGRDGTPITVTPFNIEPIHDSGSAIVQAAARNSARPAFAGLCG